jgi:hypothetical protein
MSLATDPVYLLRESGDRIMSDATNQTLSEAYELIEADRLAEAEAILKPILTSEPDNADAWWVYAHAVTDVETARMALNKVLNIDDTYPGAMELLNNLEDKYPGRMQPIERGQIRKLAPPVSLPDLPEDEDIDNIELDLDSTQKTIPDYSNGPKPVKRRSMIPLLAGLILVAIIAVVLVLVVRQPGTVNTIAGTTTSVQQQAAVTEVVSSVLDAEVTPASDATTSDLTGVLADFTLVENGIGTLDTSFGKTLVTGVCSTAGQEMRDTLDSVMSKLPSAISNIEADVAAVGVRLVDCSTNIVLRVIAVPIDEAKSYAAGTTDDDTYQSKWVAVA